MTKKISAKEQLDILTQKIDDYRNPRNGPSPSGRLNKYKSQYVKGKKKIDGKWVWWDDNLDKPFNKKEVEQNLYHEAIGTTTPVADQNYLSAQIKHDKKVNLGPNPLRQTLSAPKHGTNQTVYGSDYQLKIQTGQEAIVNKFTNKEGSNFSQLAHDTYIKGAAEELNLGSKPPTESVESTQTKLAIQKAEGNTPTDGGDQLVASLKNEKGGTNDKDALNLEDVNKYGGITPTVGDYTALESLQISNRNQPSNKSELTIKKEEPLLKSDVFTLDADGNRLGVMGHTQRRIWDKNNQELMRKNQLKIASRTYSSGFVGAG